MAVNAIGNDSKYGIHYQQAEFLRVWYADRAYGYPNRALPSILQRKPWSSDPWDPEGVLKAQLITVDTLERRSVKDCEWLRAAVVRDWTRIRGQSNLWLQLPTTLGGLGLLPFRDWVCDKVWPKVERQGPRFSVEPQSYKRYQTKFAEWNVTEVEAQTLQQQTMASKALADDVRGIAHVYRDDYRGRLKALGAVRWRKVSPHGTQLRSLTGSIHYLSSISNAAELALSRKSSGTFGQYKSTEQWFMDAQVVARLRGTRVMPMLRDHDPDCYYEVRRLERKGLHRGNALDFVFGRIAGVLTGRLHSLLAHSVTVQLARCVEDQLRWSRETFGWLTTHVGTTLATALHHSPLAKTAFWW